MNDIQQEQPKASALDSLLFLAIKHKQALVVALALVAAVLAGLFFWTRSLQQREAEASLALSRLTPLLERGMLQEAIGSEEGAEGLREVASRYDGTPSGEMASLLMASALAALGEQEAALAAFDGASMANPDLQAAVLAGKAALRSDQEAYGEAATGFEKASAKAANEALKAIYLLQAADSHLAAGNPGKAREHYETTKNSWPGTTAATLAQRGLWQLSGAEQP